MIAPSVLCAILCPPRKERLLHALGG